ncbi:MAG: hypothetical protein U1E15_13380 [Hyphomicrobiales bacterium]
MQKVLQTPLVLVPALGCDGRLYEPQLAAWQGGVMAQLHVAREDRFAAMVAGLLAAAPAQFAILGTSMGARLAIEVALAAPDRVKGLLVIGSTAGGVADPAAGHRRTARLRNGELEGVLGDMARMISHGPGPRGEDTRAAFITMGRLTGAAIMAAQSDALAHRAELWPRMAEIVCPTPACGGGKTSFHRWRMACGWRGRCAGAPMWNCLPAGIFRRLYIRTTALR